MEAVHLEAIVARHDLDYAAVVKNKTAYKPPAITGVYFLLKGSEVVFVGQSADVLVRIGQHWAEKEKEFDGYTVIECRADEQNLVQAHFICKFKPLHNSALPQQEMFKSLPQLKRVLGVDLRELKKLIRLHSIQDHNGFYKVGDFASWLPTTTKTTQRTVPLGECEGCGHKVNADVRKCTRCGQWWPYTDDRVNVARQAIEHWKHGERTGEWEPLLSMMTEDAKVSDWYRRGGANQKDALKVEYGLLRRSITTFRENTVVAWFNGLEDAICFEFRVHSYSPMEGGVDGMIDYTSYVDVLVHVRGDKVDAFAHLYVDRVDDY